MNLYFIKNKQSVLCHVLDKNDNLSQNIEILVSQTIIISFVCQHTKTAILPVKTPLWHPADPPLVLPPLPLPGQPPNDPSPYLQHRIQICIMDLLIEINHSKLFS